MGLFDNAMMDWNGDGRIDHWDSAIETAVIMDQLDREGKEKQPQTEKNPGSTQNTRFRRNPSRRK